MDEEDVVHIYNGILGIKRNDMMENYEHWLDVILGMTVDVVVV